MGFRKDSYATVWSVEAKTPSVTKVRISISKKNKQTGEYEQDFSGFVNFCGTAASNALKLHEKDRIKLGDVDVTTWYNKEKKIEYTNYACFSFDMADSTFQQQTQPDDQNDPSADDVLSDESIPF